MFYYENYGIEFFRKIIFQDIVELFNNYNMNIEKDYLNILIDYMCKEGYPLKYNFNGLEMNNNFNIFQNILSQNILKYIKIGCEAGVNDPLTGMTEQIFAGKMLKLGANYNS